MQVHLTQVAFQQGVSAFQLPQGSSVVQAFASVEGITLVCLVTTNPAESRNIFVASEGDDVTGYTFVGSVRDEIAGQLKHVFIQ